MSHPEFFKHAFDLVIPLLPKRLAASGLPFLQCVFVDRLALRVSRSTKTHATPASAAGARRLGKSGLVNVFKRSG
jgi:hypothetical protein